MYLFNLEGGSTSVIILVSANSFGQAAVYIFLGHLNPSPVPSEYSHSWVHWAEFVLPVLSSSLTCHFKGFYFSDNYIFLLMYLICLDKESWKLQLMADLACHLLDLFGAQPSFLH